MEIHWSKYVRTLKNTKSHFSLRLGLELFVLLYLVIYSLHPHSNH